VKEQLAPATNLPSLIVSLSALAFTIFSFYWLNFRRGKLVVARPRTFACLGGSQRARAHVYLPLIFSNSGAAHLVVENLRLVFLESPLMPFSFIATVARLGTSENRHFATPFSIKGREAVALICEFQREHQLVFEAKRYDLRLDFRFSGEDDWRTAAEFSLHFNQEKATIANGAHLIALDNE